MKRFLCALLLFAPLFSQEEKVNPGIKDGHSNGVNIRGEDVAQFLKSFPVIKDELEKLGAKYEATNPDDPSSGLLILEKYANELDNIVKKQGYASFENFINESSAITSAYSYILYEREQMPKLKAGIENSKKQMQAMLENPKISEEDKKEIRKGLQEMEKMKFENPLKDTPEENIKAVEPYFEKLKEVFEE